MYLRTNEYLSIVKRFTDNDITEGVDNLYEAAAQDDLRLSYECLGKLKEMIDRLYDLYDFVRDMPKEAKGEQMNQYDLDAVKIMCVTAALLGLYVLLYSLCKLFKKGKKK